MQKQKLTREQKDKILLSFLHEDYKINTEQNKGDLDLFNRECARYFALKGKNPLKNNGYAGSKYVCVTTKEFGGSRKHILRSEFDNFKTLITSYER